MTSASAPGKLILCGEHAVVYGRPAIAAPLGDLRAYARLEAGEPGSGLCFSAPDLGETWTAAGQPEHPLSELALATLARLRQNEPDLTIELRSDIPIASGMGSGAAIGTALVRALATHAGATLAPEEVAALVYASERRFHGTPSGIDNTVVAHERAIWFVRREPAPLIETLTIARPLLLVVGDTGVRSATRLPVGAVRERWRADPPRYEALFDRVAELVTQARAALATGDAPLLGALLNANQALLEQIGVSSPELERLVAAARAAGALGAKLSGAGWGGVMLALVTPENRPAVENALQEAGAARVLAATVPATGGVEGLAQPILRPCLL
ncbi:MAG: mevalonate kinase [Oscillochloridaceae bacterium]|nr:mevalonate kinase [Chloroflexaceae bacterium]MDW8389100.1 mevalonate kinase [Oscillochloridaceae bacterium]